MQKKLLVRSLLVCAVACLVGTAAFAGENWVGTWKLNAAKPQMSGGIRAETLKFEATPAGIKLTSEGTDAQGKPMKGGYTAKFDGTDVPWAGNPMADTASPKRIDDNSYENVWKKGGKVTVTATVSVSADGKTLTVIQDGTDPKGAKVHSVAVYDKQ
ncbi:MAG TPA: hypothetical protein VLF95_14030 [Vicinamibacteria bacterium]|nr:hypothetical protein [Vicinamibacteria bacterium]